MSANQLRLASLLLREHFGDIVQNVAVFLMKNGAQPLDLIIRGTKLEPEKVKNAVCVLVLHHWTSFMRNSKGVLLYKLNVENIILILRYPKYIFCVKTLFGDVAELLIEKLLFSGETTMSEAIEAVSKSMPYDIQPSQVHEKFISLVQTHFVVRCPAVEDQKEDAAVPQFVAIRKDMYTVPHIPETYFSTKRKLEIVEESQPKKKIKIEEDYFEKVPDEGIYWQVNFDRFHQFFRDQAIVSAISNRIDNKAAEVVRTMLRLLEVKSDPWCATTAGISKYEIVDAASKDVGLKPLEVEQYLSLLNDDTSRFVRKVEDSQGGIYVVNMKEAVTALAWATVETVVQERFGSKSLRIFRLLQLKKYLEQKQIEELAMIPAKDAKEMTYNMFQENFLQVQEIPRTPDHAPSRTFFLFHADLMLVSRMLQEQCYKTILNVKIKNEAENKEHKRLLEKQQRIKAILSSLQQEGADVTQLQEVEDMITPPERTQIQFVKQARNKLDQSELAVDKTIFILQIYLRYLHVK